MLLAILGQNLGNGSIITEVCICAPPRWISWYGCTYLSWTQILKSRFFLGFHLSFISILEVMLIFNSGAFSNCYWSIDQFLIPAFGRSCIFWNLLPKSLIVILYQVWRDDYCYYFAISYVDYLTSNLQILVCCFWDTVNTSTNCRNEVGYFWQW